VTTRLLLVLFGGMALLLYGMQLTGEGLQRAAGARLRQILTHLTSNRLTAVLTGAGVTALIQSSTATTVMLIGFVQAGLLTLHQAMGIILGADIGTTFTVQLLAFRVYDYALLLVGLGFTTLFFVKRRVFKDLGQAVLGFGLIFLGLKLMIEGMEPLKNSSLVAQVLLAFAESPILGIAAAAVFSAVVHSSAATIGLAIALSTHGLLPLAGAVPLVLGANIGTCATALAASVGATAEAKRVAMAHIAFKVLGAALMLPFIGPFTTLVASSAVHPARQVANAHTFFNLGISLLFLPFTPWAARVIETLVPDDQTGDTPFRTRYLDERAQDQPSLALGQATREALRMADVVQGMLRDTMEVFRTDNQALLEEVEQRDDQVDFLEREIKLFLARLGREAMGPELSRKEIGLISFIGNLENIGDIIDKNLMELARKKFYQGRRFSEAGWAEILDFHGLVGKNLERAIAAFAANDRTLAQEVLDQRPFMRARERELRESHLGRLRAGLAESIETSEIHLDVLTNLKRISSHVSALMFPILDEV
jgi:phosphate:Na+ symporter